MQSYNKFIFLFFFKFLSLNKKINIKHKINLASNFNKKMLLVLSKKKKFLKLVLFFNKKIIYFKNLKKKFFIKFKWKVKKKITKLYIKKIIRFIILKIKIFLIRYNRVALYFCFKFIRTPIVNKISWKKQFNKNFIRWFYFNKFRKLLKKNLKYKYKSFFNKSHSKLNEKSKKLRRK